MLPRSGGAKADGLVSDLGERRIIEVLRKRLRMPLNLPVPFGDDVAGFALDGERLAVLKTDMLVGRTDVPSGMSLRQAARKAVVMNVSDFAAKGVQPSAVLVSLGLPKTMKVGDVKAIGEGLDAGAREYGVYVVGGDTGEASDLVIAVFLYGVGTQSKLMLRSGAKAGDVVGVTGLFGKTAAGLRLNAKDCGVPREVCEVLLDSIFMPKARLGEGLALAESGAVTSSIDSSDGFAWSLHELSRMSKVGFVIDNLPLADEAIRFADCCGVDASELALYGGEEYELVVTVKPERWVDAEKAVEAVGGKLLRVGRVTGRKQVLLKFDDKTIPIEARGWEHFKSEA